MNASHLEKALRDANNCIAGDLVGGALHHKRSREWVRCLGKMLSEIVDRPNTIVFIKDEESKDFKLSEMLFDVCVCETSTIPTKHATRADLQYITKAVWIVESEFSDNFAEAVKDFSKLVIGAADNKLFVGPKVSDRKDAEVRERLLPVAERCRNSDSTNVYFAQVSHPGTWKDSTPTASGWRLNETDWEPLE